MTDTGDKSGDSGYAFPIQSPLFHAQHADRYARQTLIGAYQAEFGCRLVVMIDEIFPDNIAMFEELIFDADPEEDLHLMLVSPGGDGETAVRLARSAQARCRELTIIVPDQAKSAATLLAIGADHIMMGPTSDLGPVDPQFRIGRDLVSAKNILAAVEQAEKRVQANPETFPLHASMLSDLNSLMVEEARSELARTDELLEEALQSVAGRNTKTVKKLAKQLHSPLVEERASHAAVFGAADASDAGLPVIEVDPSSRQWKMIWMLYAKYLSLGSVLVYEGRYVSQVRPLYPAPPPAPLQP